MLPQSACNWATSKDACTTAGMAIPPLTCRKVRGPGQEPARRLAHGAAPRLAHRCGPRLGQSVRRLASGRSAWARGSVYRVHIAWTQRGRPVPFLQRYLTRLPSRLVRPRGPSNFSFKPTSRLHRASSSAWAGLETPTSKGSRLLAFARFKSIEMGQPLLPGAVPGAKSQPTCGLLARLAS